MRRAAALIAFVVVAVTACVPDPPPPPPPSIAGVAGTPDPHSYEATWPTTPTQARSIGLNVYAVTMSAPNAASVYLAGIYEILRYDRAADTVQRVAGTGHSGPTPGTPALASVGLPATAANLNWVPSHAVTPDGSIWFVNDYDAGYVFRIDPSGVLEIGAGTGTPGPAGDGGLATSAQVQAPDQLTVGKDGDLYFLDVDRVRRIDLPSGTISTSFDFGTPTFGGPSAGEMNPLLSVDSSGQVLLIDRSKLVQRVTPGGLTPVSLSGATCVSQDWLTILDGRLADGRVAVVTASIDPLTNLVTDRRECRIDPDTGVASQTPLDTAGSSFIGYYAEPRTGIVSAQISRHIVLGPDGVRWLVGRSNQDGIQMFRWSTG